jgi:GMP synthase (glutamine-hydrolysing)
MTRILILRTGSTSPSVQALHGDFDRWFTDAMSGWQARFEVRDLVRGDRPEPEGCDGILVTGSTRSACAEEPWMEPLIAFLRGCESSGVPLLGVCFGSQILAHARGGRVILNPEGWEIGAVSIELTAAGQDDPLMAGLPRRFTSLATHEDRVEALPPGAVLLAGNANTPIQAFRAARSVWGVQFHPELSPGPLGILIRERSEKLERDAVAHGRDPRGHVERLLASLTGPDVMQGKRVLGNFVALCGGIRTPGR